MGPTAPSNDRILLGCCIRDVGEIPVVAAAGVDFCELRVWPTVMDATADLGGLARTLERAGTHAFAGNAFMPGALAIVGPGVDKEAVDLYVGAALSRMQGLGMRCLVLTAGGTRGGPPGYPRADAIQEFAGFVRRTAELSRRADIQLTIEPVRPEQSRILNSVAEAAGFIRFHGLDGVLIAADVFHMLQAGESGDALRSDPGLLGHLHVAGPDRGPEVASAAVNEILRAAAAYTSPPTWSLECSWSDMKRQLSPALAHLRLMQ